MFDTVIQAVVTALNSGGISAVRKYPRTALNRDGSSVVVNLKSGSVTASGYGNYLGIYETDGVLKEYYGSRAELKLGIEIYTANAAGYSEPKCTDLLGDVFSCIGNISGVKIRGFEHSEPRYDTETDMFCCETVLSLTVFLVSENQGGSFTDFVLRGELK